MKKVFRKTVSVLLCIAMLISMSIIGASATQRYTDCNGECQYYPTIIVPGLGQSNTWVLDDNGDFVLDDEGNKISSFPAYIKTDEVLSKVLVPAVLSLVLQRDAGLTEAASDVIRSCFGINTCDENAQPSPNVYTERYPYPVSECRDFETEEIFGHVPFDLYETEQPYDHMYYFAYNSFGNHFDLVNELYDFIQMVKEQTGHDKVNLVPLSQGASIVSAMLDYKPEVQNDLHKVIFVVPALDGSTIIGDVFNGRVSFLNKEYVYNGFLGESGLLDKGTAALIEMLFRILPDEVLMSALESAVNTLVGEIMVKSTGMWALCPSGDYPTAAEKYLSSPEMANIKAQTDRYYQAQLNSDRNIQNLVDNGVQVFCFVEYDVAMINVGETWNTQNADYIIHTDSTSMGAHFANVGETLPEDYVQQNTHCSDPTHNHISPDRVVDASTGLLPDTTFYFDGQRHDLTARNDVILKLALNLIESDRIQNVYSLPEFPQFNVARGSEKLVILVEQAKEIDPSTLSDEDAAELAAAIDEAEKVIDSTIGVVGEVEASEARVTACLVKAGVMEAPDEGGISLDIFMQISPWFYENFGTDGYSELIIRFTMKVMQTVVDTIVSFI
ncbi:MAG: hypothetical protein J6L62_03350 [Clostridia bacterium]|nr:hypothetical protein [Clostridia bacterium]